MSENDKQSCQLDATKQSNNKNKKVIFTVFWKYRFLAKNVEQIGIKENALYMVHISRAFFKF